MQNLLSLMTFVPLLGVPLVMLLPAARPNLIRGVAAVFSGIPLLLAIPLWRWFDPAATGLQFEEHIVWIRSFNIEYFMAVDGISISMVILTALISFIACLASFGIEKSIRGYFAMFLLLETGMMGVFCAMDFFLFYVFWELISRCTSSSGSGAAAKYAAIKFFLYTLAGSVVMLLALIAIYYTSGPARLVDGTVTEHTFNLVYLTEMGRNGTFDAAAPIFGLAFPKVIFLGLFLGFSIKVPMFPFHTWLPDAHVDAPTPISVILAGILLKTGMYGILRFNLQMLPDAMWWAAPGIALFGVISIVYGAFVCLAQKDLKKLIAYSSVSHMGFCLLGMAALTPQGISGSVFQMFSHGIISPMLFLLAGVIYDRAHTREINGFGGLAGKMPEYTGLTGLAFMASLGLPGLAGFIGEVLVFLGGFGASDPIFRWFVVAAVPAVVITAGYYLWTMQRMFLGQMNPKWSHLWDMNWRERLTLYPLAAATILLGFWPAPVFKLVNTSLHHLVGVITGGT